MTSGGCEKRERSVKTSIKLEKKKQIAPNITSEGSLDQLLLGYPTEEQIAFLVGHLDTTALIDMDPSMLTQA